MDWKSSARFQFRRVEGGLARSDVPGEEKQHEQPRRMARAESTEGTIWPKFSVPYHTFSIAWSSRGSNLRKTVFTSCSNAGFLLATAPMKFANKKQGAGMPETVLEAELVQM